MTKENLTNYISKEGRTRMANIIANSKHPLTVQNNVDIYRLFLLYENGGMWLDTNSFLIGTLNWIEEIDQEVSVYNKISSDP